MSEQKPTVVLVHGAFSESASWNGVIERLNARSYDVVAAANPLRSVTRDAAYLRDVIAGIGKPVVVVGHSYGGMAMTEASAGQDLVRGLVYVAAFAPDHGESALELSTIFPAAPSATHSPRTRSPPVATRPPSRRRSSTTSSPPTSTLPTPQ